MPITGLPIDNPLGPRAQAETVLARRVGAELLGALKVSAASDGTNADFADPIVAALRSLGYSTAMWSDVTDVDVGQVADPQADQFLEAAELRLLETLLTRARRLHDTAVGQEQERFGDIARGLETTLKRRYGEYREKYLLGHGRLELGQARSTWSVDGANFSGWPPAAVDWPPRVFP